MVNNGLGLSKTLNNRHIQFIALGGAIGASLFVGSGQGIRIAGPSILGAFLIAGASVYFMARAMGELLLAHPAASSFVGLIEQYLGGWAGFVAGWSYWLLWVLVGIVEATAISMVIRYWYPDIPQWLPVLIALLSLYAINRSAVRLFAEMEFWLTLVKIVTILLLIGLGIVMVVGHIGPTGQEASITKLWRSGGFFAQGMVGFLAVLPLAVFTFGGTELIGVTATEAADPARSIPKAIKSVIFRILFFYIGTLAVIMMVVDWRSLDPAVSPFVLLFRQIGFSAAAGFVNFVVLTAIASSLNSGIFATGRMLYGLALQGDAPRGLAMLDRRRLPARGIFVSTLAMLCGVGLNYLFPDEVFGFVISVVSALLLLTWTMIILSHLRFKQLTVGKLTSVFPMPLHPWSGRVVLAFYGVVALLMCIDPQSRPTAYSFAAWLLGISLVYKLFVSHRRVPVAHIEVDR